MAPIFAALCLLATALSAAAKDEGADPSLAAPPLTVARLEEERGPLIQALLAPQESKISPESPRRKRTLGFGKFLNIQFGSHGGGYGGGYGGCSTGCCGGGCGGGGYGGGYVQPTKIYVVKDYGGYPSGGGGHYYPSGGGCGYGGCQPVQQPCTTCGGGGGGGGGSYSQASAQASASSSSGGGYWG